MKIADMIKKIETYNEVADMIGNPKAELRAVFGYGRSIKVETLKSFRKFIRDEYIKVVADAILACEEYEFGKEIEIKVVDIFGDELLQEVEFYAE